MTNDSPLPDHLKRWNWGAFVFTWIWGVGNSTYSAFKVFIPIYGIYYSFKLGAQGNAMAWKHGRWDDVEHFARVQRNWAKAALIYTGVMFSLFLPLWVVVSGSFKDSEAMSLSTAALEESAAFRDNVGTPYKIGFITGNMSWSADGGSAELAFGVSGPRGKARCYTQAKGELGVWELSCLRVVYRSDSGEELLGACAESSDSPP